MFSLNPMRKSATFCYHNNKHKITFFGIWQTSAIFVYFDNFTTLKKSQYWLLVMCRKSGQVCKSTSSTFENILNGDQKYFKPQN